MRIQLAIPEAPAPAPGHLRLARVPQPAAPFKVGETAAVLGRARYTWREKPADEPTDLYIREIKPIEKH